MSKSDNPTGRDEIFARACCGDEAALAFLHTIFHAADVADDVHDGDTPAKVADVLHAMASVNLNAFFRAHQDGLSALMLTGSLSWDLSNDMTGPAQAFYAAQLEQLLFYVAMLCGGYGHAKAIALAWIK